MSAVSLVDKLGIWEMRMTSISRVGLTLVAAVLIGLGTVQSDPARAGEELSEKSIQTFMDYAWSLVPQQFTMPNGKTILVDKKLSLIHI